MEFNNEVFALHLKNIRDLEAEKRMLPIVESAEQQKYAQLTGKKFDQQSYLNYLDCLDYLDEPKKPVLPRPVAAIFLVLIIIGGVLIGGKRLDDMGTEPGSEPILMVFALMISLLILIVTLVVLLSVKLNNKRRVLAYNKELSEVRQENRRRAEENRRREEENRRLAEENRHREEENRKVYEAQQNFVNVTVPELQNNLTRIMTEVAERTKEVNRLLDEAYAINLIPGPYRGDLAAIEYLYEMASTTQLGYTDIIMNAKMEEGIRRMERRMNALIGEIIRNTEETRILRHSVDTGIQTLKQQLEQQKQQLEQQNVEKIRRLSRIEENTARSAQYSKVAANYAETNAYYQKQNYYINLCDYLYN